MKRALFSGFIIFAVFIAGLNFSVDAASAGPRIPVLKMLSGEGCPACIEMAKVLDKIDAQYKGRLNTQHIDLADRPDLAKKYKVRYIPTLVFVDTNGQDVKIEVGYRSLDEVLKIFEKAGVKI